MPSTGECTSEPTRPGRLLASALIPAAILKDPSLSAGARLLWVFLAGHQGKSAQCFPLEATLALQLGVKVGQLQTCLKELENYTRGDPPEPFPLIEVKRVWGKERKTRNIYSLLRRPFLAVNRIANGAREADLADGGNAQYSAHRSEGDVQDTAAAAEQPEIPTEDASVGLSALPHSNAQYSAHRTRRRPKRR